MERQDNRSGGGTTPNPDQTNFSLLKAYFSNSFVKYFENISGPKSVFFDEGLLKVLSFVIDNPPPSAKLAETLVLSGKQVLQVNNETVVFIVRPEIEVIKNVIFQKSNWQSDRDYYILFVPRRTIECDELLENEKMFNEEKISQIAMDLIPLEEDLLSLELQDNFAHYMLADDDSYKVYIQNSINRIETVFGPIKYKYGKGDDACQILNRIRDTFQLDGSQASGLESEIDCMILLDRNVDLITPFCIAQTYEGLLDEHFGIQTCSITVSSSIVKSDSKDKEKGPQNLTLVLTNEDQIFKEVRDKHFSTLEKEFSSKLQLIQNIIREKDAPQSIEALEAYILKLKNMNIAKGKDMLTHHINLASYMNSQMKNIDHTHCQGLEQKIILGEDLKSIIGTLETKMAKQYKKNMILRFLCLFSVTQGGLKKEDFDSLRKFYMMNYGYQEMITLMNLQDAKILKVKEKKVDWAKLKKTFKLINEETRIVDPIDISYVYNGYSPLSVKFIETLMVSGGFRNMEEKVKMLPGAAMSPINEHEFFAQSRQAGNPDQARKKRVLVYYIGGITYGEIAAIRFLNKLFKDKKFIIATTQIINGESCIEMLRGKIQNNLDVINANSISNLRQFETSRQHPIDNFSAVGGGTFQSMNFEATDQFHDTQNSNEPAQQKTQELITEYQSILSDMRSQVNSIKGKFGMQKGAISNVQFTNQESVQNRIHQRGNSYNFTRQNNGNEDNGIYSQECNSPMKIEDIQMQLQQQPQRHYGGINMQSSISSNQHNYFSQSNLRSIEKMGPCQTLSPQDEQFMRRRTDQYNSKFQKDTANKRQYVSNLKQSLTDENALSTSSQFKITESYCASPTSDRRLNFNNYQNKENINTNSPPVLSQQASPNMSGNKHQQQYHDQVKLNKQLIDQVKCLKQKLVEQPGKVSQEQEVQMIKLIQNEEFLKDKCLRLEQENYSLADQLRDITFQVESSLKNNQELESYLENCEVSVQQNNEKHKGFNKKIQDLNKRNAELQQRNNDLEQKQKQLEQDKAKISEKWIRVSARSKIEEKNKNKAREREMQNEQFNKEIQMLKQKVEIVERENEFLKDQNDQYKQKVSSQGMNLKDVTGKLEGLDKEKHLADKVTNELLQRIHRYESEIQELKQKNERLLSQVSQTVHDSEELQIVEQEMREVQAKMDQMVQEGAEMQQYTLELECQNQELGQELQQFQISSQNKDQQIEALQLSLEHQTEQSKEMHHQFQDIIQQYQKQASITQLRFSSQDLQNSIDFLIENIHIDEDRDQLESEGNLDSECMEDQAITGIIVKAAQRIKFLNKYIEGLKNEIEETTEKYDRLAIKFRDLGKEFDQIQNLCQVTMVQKDNSDQQSQELKQYVQELEAIIKNGGQSTMDMQHDLSHQAQFLETFQGSHDNNMNGSIGQDQQHIYQSFPHHRQNSQDSNGHNQNLMYEAQSQQQKSFQGQNPRFLERVVSQRQSIIVPLQQSYDHTRICMPTRFINPQQKSLVSNSLSSFTASCQSSQPEFSLQDQIKTQIASHKRQEQMLKGNGGNSNSQLKYQQQQQLRNSYQQQQREMSQENNQNSFNTVSTSPHTMVGANNQFWTQRSSCHQPLENQASTKSTRQSQRGPITIKNAGVISQRKSTSSLSSGRFKS